jgi:hypothetical protein
MSVSGWLLNMDQELEWKLVKETKVLKEDLPKYKTLAAVVGVSD